MYSLLLQFNHTLYPWECGSCVLRFTFCSLGESVSSGDPEKKKNWVNCQVLGEVAVSFVVQSLCNGKVQGLFQVLTRICENESSQLDTSKLC